MNKENIFEKEGYVMPVIILTVICLVVSGILGYVNSLTAPVIEAANIATSNAAKKEMVPSAKSFDNVAGTFPKGVSEVAKADNGAGLVITVTGAGAQGDVKLMVAIHDGKIIGTKCLEQGETPGLGDKIKTDVNFINQFVGKDKNLDGVATISGATISSSAYKNIVKTAFEAYEIAGRG